MRNDFFRFIDLGVYPDLLFLLLTKRPSNINKFIPGFWQKTPPENVIFGTSPCDQETYDNLKKHLLKVNGKRFLSIEPQLADIDLGDLSGIHWVIQGGESGHHKRLRVQDSLELWLSAKNRPEKETTPLSVMATKLNKTLSDAKNAENDAPENDQAPHDIEIAANSTDTH